MKKSFMTRVLAVSLSAAMAFSLSSANMMTASAAATVSIAKTKTLTAVTDKGKKLKLKNNTSKKWKIKSASSTKKAVCATYGQKAQYVKLNPKKAGKATIRVKVINKKTNKTKLLKCKVTVVKQQVDPGPGPDDPVDPTDEALRIDTINPTSLTTAEVRFNKAVDAATLVKENFKVTTEAGAELTVTAAAPSANNTSVVLTIPDAARNTKYTVTASNLTVDGVAQTVAPAEFTTPTTSSVSGQLSVVDEKGEKRTTVVADGQDTVTVRFELLDQAGKVMENADGLQVTFAATHGTLEPTKQTMQDGVAVARYSARNITSVISDTITATVDAATVDQMDIPTTSAAVPVTLEPYKGASDTTEGIFLLAAESGQADRIIAYFNQKVDVKKYLTATGAVNTTAATIEAWSERNNSYTGGRKVGSIVGLLPVEGNDKAMQILLSEPLTDNSNVSLRFQDNTGKIVTNNTVNFRLTDAYQPAALRASNPSMRQVQIVFSEPMLNATAHGRTGGVTNSNPANANSTQYGAEAVTNYYLDGVRLDNYGADASAVIGTYDNVNGTGADNRHIVTLTLGKDANGKNRYLKAGRHYVTINNVGDWAAASDGDHNIITNQVLYFDVQANTDKPYIVKEKTEVQSPEQIKVVFNETIESEANVPVESLIQLQTTSRSGAENWTELLDSGNQKRYQVTAVPGGNNKEFLIQLKEDWSQIWDEESTGKSYPAYRVRIHVNANAIYNVANGEKNTSEINEELTDDKITKHDNKSPVIQSIKRGVKADGSLENFYVVTMDEPVKISNAANDEGITPSQREERLYGTGQIANAQANFQNVQTGDTIKATILDTFNDNYDMQIRVVPDEELPAGRWILVARSISDDYGNAAATVYSDEIQVAGEVSGFKVVWAAVSDNADYMQSWLAGTEPNPNKVASGLGKYIFIKFNQEIGVGNQTTNALERASYRIANQPLPANAKVTKGIQGYDTNSAQKPNGYCDSVTIDLSDTSMSLNVKNTILWVSNQIVSAGNESLSNGGEKTIPLNVSDERVVAGSTTDNSKNDAVYGNAVDNSENGVGLSAAAYVDLLNSKLKDDQYRVVKVARSGLDLTELKKTLKITRPVVLDLGGNTITGDVVANFSHTGTVVITNGRIATKNGSKLTINTPNADWVIGAEKVNSTTKKTATVDSIKVDRILNDTLTNYGTISEINVADATGAGIVNDGGTINKINVDTGNAAPTIAITNTNAGTISFVELASSVTLDLSKTTTKIAALAVNKNATVKVDNGKALSDAVTSTTTAVGATVTQVAGSTSTTVADAQAPKKVVGQAAVDAVLGAVVAKTTTAGAIATNYIDVKKLTDAKVDISKITITLSDVKTAANSTAITPGSGSITVGETTKDVPSIDSTEKVTFTITVKYVDGDVEYESKATKTVEPKK